MHNKFQIGDLVTIVDRKKRKRLIRQKNYFVEEIDNFGVGIIVDKLEQLFVFPHGLTNDSDEDTKDKLITKNNLTSTPTNISKVYWVKFERMRWEYEDDLVHYVFKHPIIKFSLTKKTLEAEVHPKIVETLKNEPYNTIYWCCMDVFCHYTQKLFKTHNMQ